VEWTYRLYAASGFVLFHGRREKSTASHSLFLVTIPTELSWLVKRERGHWVDLDVDGRIILRWIFGKWEEVETGWSWLRVGTGGGHL